MARLPVPGSDDGVWGSILNDYMLQAHTDQGTLKDNIVGSAQIQTNAVGSSQLANDAVTNAAIADGAINEAQLDAAVQAKLNTAAGVTSVNAKTGDVVLDKADIGLANVDNTSDANKPVSTATQTALNAKADTSALTAHTSDTNNPHSVTKAQVGLANVDDTSDLNKPISTATQTALDTKANTDDVGAKLLLIDNAGALPPGTPADVVVVLKA